VLPCRPSIDRTPSTDGRGDLDGRRSHAAGAGMHQRPASAGETTLHHQRIPRGEEHLGYGRRVVERHPVGHCHQHAFVRGNAFGIRATCFDTHHSVARLPHRDPLADRADHAGELETGYLGHSPAGVGIEPHSLQEVGPVQCRGCHLDHHFLGPRHRVVDLVDAEDFGATVGMKDDCAHGPSLTCRSGATPAAAWLPRTRAVPAACAPQPRRS